MFEHAIPLAFSVVRTYGAATAVQVVLGISVASAAAYFIPSQRRIQKGKADEATVEDSKDGPEVALALEKRQWRREIPFMLRNGLVQAAFFTGIERLRARGTIRLARGLVDGSRGKTLVLVGAQFAGYWWLFDVYYYFLHRFLLHGALWSVHEPHHKTFVPEALTAFLFHPVEAIVTGGFVHFIAWLTGGRLHVGTYGMVLAWGVLDSLFVHLGFQIVPVWFERSKWTNWLMTTQIHDLHHSRVRCCYGGFSTVWDRLFGTLDEDAVESQLKRIERQIGENPAAARKNE